MQSRYLKPTENNGVVCNYAGDPSITQSITVSPAAVILTVDSKTRLRSFSVLVLGSSSCEPSLGNLSLHGSAGGFSERKLKFLSLGTLSSGLVFRYYISSETVLWIRVHVLVFRIHWYINPELDFV
jgi:hypothetical protein